MPRDYYQIKEDIQAAIASLSPHEIPNISKLAREFNVPRVPRKRLGARLKGRATRGERPPTNQRMTDAQILALELYVARLDAIGQPPLISQLRAAAESIQSLTTRVANKQINSSYTLTMGRAISVVDPHVSKEETCMPLKKTRLLYALCRYLPTVLQSQAETTRERPSLCRGERYLYSALYLTPGCDREASYL
ncbi:hypothetical protein GQ44DRAFT_190840 [Phaeosphaeriaceae sp. PMI808]|nr:hypothetical protein GQ44DRAFT_190840 [Phaeosphaeriaceae sp. PMI808]